MKIKIQELSGREVVNQDKIERAARWLKEGTKTSLMIMGGVGTGKTTLAKAIGLAIGPRNSWPRYMSMPKLERICTADNTWLDEVAGYQILVLDDVGTENREILLYGNRRMLFPELLYQRYDARRPTIITTNLDPEAFGQRYGERVVSRCREMFDIMIMNGKDLRQ